MQGELITLLIGYQRHLTGDVGNIIRSQRCEKTNVPTTSMRLDFEISHVVSLIKATKVIHLDLAESGPLLLNISVNIVYICIFIILLRKFRVLSCEGGRETYPWALHSGSSVTATKMSTSCFSERLLRSKFRACSTSFSWKETMFK